MNKLANLIDDRIRPAGEGYVAERHPSFPNVILVWGPCDCCWVGNAEEEFVNTCGKPDCSFSYPDAALALEALRAAEEANGKDEEHSLMLLEAQASDMISEGGPNG